MHLQRERAFSLCRCNENVDHGSEKKFTFAVKKQKNEQILVNLLSKMIGQL